ncbi:hypothetical protein Y1Q_0009750 [Alligator mississippiensis]|uniref:Uncharacterized protein n=1 Tax=Alligator mississippiensis TaxID=8496 RepID=A0A151MWN0_ALLMI|nr:hypothetical protein Y1Q_0009750 [Alligator mississippiensis]
MSSIQVVYRKVVELSRISVLVSKLMKVSAWKKESIRKKQCSVWDFGLVCLLLKIKYRINSEGLYSVHAWGWA